MPTQNPTIKLPPERLEQLKALAATLNLSISDTIGHLIRNEIAKGTIPNELPWIIVRREKDEVTVNLGEDQPVARMSLAGAKAFARDIRIAANTAEPAVVNFDHNYAALRVGSGIEVSAPFGKSKRVVACDVARDLAQLIDAAAAD